MARIKLTIGLTILVHKGIVYYEIYLFLDFVKKPHENHCLSCVSKDNQDVANQKLVILDYAQKHKIKVDEFIELSISSRKST